MLARVLLAALVLFAGPALAATHYIRDGGTASASGTGACTGWATANACDNFPATLVRGDTYCVADGSYGSVTFSTAASGSTVITVRKAVHGDGTCDQGSNWVSTYGDGQAVFGSIIFASGYWTFDGVTGGGPGAWETGHGFYSTGIDDNAPFSDQNADYITISHIEIDGGSTGPEDVVAVIIDYQSNVTIEYAWIHDIGSDVFKLRYTNSNFLLQYSKVARNYQNASFHGDLIEIPAGSVSGTLIVRWNYFEDVVGSYLFGVHEYSTVSDYQIYGNIIHFKNKTSDTGNGTLGSLSGCSGCGWTVAFCNNTIAGRFGAPVLGWLEDNGGTFSSVARGNIWYEGTDSGYGFGYSTASQSHNSHYNMAAVSGTSNENPTGNPFTNIAANDLSLTAATTAAVTTGCPAGNATDMLGNTRGADGTWDRGALEYGSGSKLPGPANPRWRPAWNEWIDFYRFASWSIR